MSDVLQNAKVYRDKLLREIAQLDEFMRMATELTQLRELKAPPAMSARVSEASVDSDRQTKLAPAANESECGAAIELKPAPETKGAEGRKLGLSFRNASGPAELDRKKLLA